MPILRSLYGRLRAFDRSVLVRIRGRHLLALDMLLVVAMSYLAVALREERFLALDLVLPWWPVLVILLIQRAFSNVTFGLYSRSWRHASLPDVAIIISAVSFGSVISVLMFYGLSGMFDTDWAPGLPRSFWLIEAALSVLAFGGLRFRLRYRWERMLEEARAGKSTHKALLYGAGNAGALMARSARRSPEVGVEPVGFLDDDPRLKGTIVAELPVFGDLGALDQALAKTGAEMLLVTMPSAPGAAVRKVVDAALERNLQVRTIPSVAELLDGSLSNGRIREVRVEDLLRRPIVTEHATGVDTIIRGQVVMVTGAAGSIGSELARQVYQLGPRRLILVDRAESPLYMVQRELQQRRGGASHEDTLRAVLGDVSDQAEMARLVAEEHPGIIFHAAAYKHVPMLEVQPSKGVRMNIRGTRTLLEVALEGGVERFVLVSTDKAVKPSSAMGATKRIAEMLVADAAQRSGRAYVSVRFGNVLGSAGSVIPIFQEQLARGGPLTVTHPEMTRYFMTIPEAAWLILDAAALGRSGDLFVLEMGEPVKIYDLARDLIRLAGQDPDSHPINITGLRPGEKLHEELFYRHEEAEPTESSKVLRVKANSVQPTLQADVDDLVALATGEREAELRAALVSYAAAG